MRMRSVGRSEAERGLLMNEKDKMATPSPGLKRWKRKRVSGIDYAATYRINTEKSFSRDADGWEPVEAYFTSSEEEDDTSFEYTPAQKTATPSKLTFTSISSPATRRASSSAVAVSTPRDQSVRASPNGTLSRSRKKRKKITYSTGPRKKTARQSISKEVEPPVKPVTPPRKADATSPPKTVTPTRLNFTNPSPPPPPTNTRSSTRTALRTTNNLRHTVSPSPQPPITSRPSTRTGTRSTNNPRHTVSPSPQPPITSRPSTRTGTRSTNNPRHTVSPSPQPPITSRHSTGTGTRSTNNLRHTVSPSPQPPITSRPSTRTGTRSTNNPKHTLTVASPSPQPPVTSTRPSTRTGTRSTNSSRHTTTPSSPPPQPPPPPPASRDSTRTTRTNSRLSTTSRSTRKDSPPLIIDSIASPSKAGAAPTDQLANASPLQTIVKPKRKRKKITCPPPASRRQPAKRTITEIQQKTDVTPGVRRSKRPNISRVPAGGYVQYKEHWGNTPSNTYGREALRIVNPIPSPTPRRNANNKGPRDEDEFYLSFASPDDPENSVRHHILFPLSHGKLCNVDGMDLQPGDDLIINRVMGSDDYQKGQMELKKGSEKPMAQNGNCEMVFRVLKGKVLAVLEDKEVEVSTDEYVLIPPGTAYQLNNVSRSNTVIDYTVIMKK